MEIIEYIRKNGNYGNKKGVMFCSPSIYDKTKVVVGFSLCNNIDRFDYIDGVYHHGFGLRLAKVRATKWENHNEFFIQKVNIDEIDTYMLYKNTNPKNVVEIPSSIYKKLYMFIDRCKSYYKDKNFPEWVDKIYYHDDESIPTTTIKYIF